MSRLRGIGGAHVPETEALLSDNPFDPSAYQQAQHERHTGQPPAPRSPSYDPEVTIEARVKSLELRLAAAERIISRLGEGTPVLSKSGGHRGA